MMPRCTRWASLAILPALAALLGGSPASQPADPTVDWLMGQSTTAPTTTASDSATSAPSVFAPKDDDAARDATMLLSSDQKIIGSFTTTPGQPIRIYDNADKQYHDVPFKLVKSLEVNVLWERDQPEWKFKASGSDVKEYSGKTYPARETEYTLTMTNGQKYSGAVAAPLYLQGEHGTTLYVIHKRDKGDVGQTIKDLVYIQRIDFKQD